MAISIGEYCQVDSKGGWMEAVVTDVDGDYVSCLFIMLYFTLSTSLSINTNELNQQPCII